MTCTTGICGTGDFPGPKPGDPDNSVSLSANAVFGGINVSWSYPTVNPHAVAYTILYRGITDVFANAMKLREVAGSFFYDQIDLPVPITYYYWIQIVSVNGTVGDKIGPVSTTSRVRYQDTLESLTGRIDEGVLAIALKTTIGGITITNGKIADEIQNRINSNAGLAAALAAAQSGAERAVTYVQQEITKRTEGDTALLNSLNTLTTAVGRNFTLFQNEVILRTTIDESFGSDISLLYTKVGDAAAAVKDEVKARTTATEAVASKITTVESALKGNIATVETGLKTNINTVDGKVTSIGALYTAKVNVNGLIGGFGVYNDGTIVDAGFDVDRFWVGRTNGDKVKPFIIDQGIVYIDKARIRDADITTLKIAGNAVSIPYSFSGTGNSNISIYMPEAGFITAVASMKAGATNPADVHFSLSGVMSDSFSIVPGFTLAYAISGNAYLSKGLNTLSVSYSANGSAALGGWNLTILGSLR